MKKINKFIILSLKMEGFKRFKEPYTMEFDRLTYISGANGQGKSTIADAIAYAFCGTPFWGEKSLDKLQNPDCKEMSVEVQLVDEDGEVHTLSRRRCGNTTTVTMDTVQLRQTDLNNIFADKDIFLSLLNPLYFIENIADNGREFLQKLLPPVDNTKVLEALSESTRAILEKQTLTEPCYFIKKLREEIRELDENDVYFEGQIDLLKSQRQEAEKNLDAVIERGKKIVERKEELEEKQYNGIDVEALKKAQSKIAETLSDDRRSKLIAKRAEIQSRAYVSKYSQQIASVMAEYKSVVGQYNSLKSKGQSIKVGDKCPTCHNVVTEQNYPNIIAEIKKELSLLAQKGNGLKNTCMEAQKLDEQSKAKFEEFRAEDLKKVENELKLMGDSDISEIAVIEDKINYGNLTTEEYDELQELIKAAEAYANEVNALAETDKIPGKIAQLEESIKYNEAKRKELKQLISAASEFAAKRAEIILNQLKMEHAAIKLYEVVKGTGEIKDTFKFTYDNKDYRWISTSEKIRAGLEVSKLLATLTGLIYPTYIDNAECITTNPGSLYGQVIFARAMNTELSAYYPLRQKKQGEQSLKEAA